MSRKIIENRLRIVLAIAISIIIIVLVYIVAFFDKAVPKKFVQEIYKYDMNVGMYTGWESAIKKYCTDELIDLYVDNTSIKFLKTYGRFNFSDPKIKLISYTNNSVRYYFDNNNIDPLAIYEMTFTFDDNNKIASFDEEVIN